MPNYGVYIDSVVYVGGITLFTYVTAPGDPVFSPAKSRPRAWGDLPFASVDAG